MTCNNNIKIIFQLIKINGFVLFVNGLENIYFLTWKGYKNQKMYFNFWTDSLTQACKQILKVPNIRFPKEQNPIE